MTAFKNDQINRLPIKPPCRSNEEASRRGETVANDRVNQFEFLSFNRHNKLDSFQVHCLLLLFFGCTNVLATNSILFGWPTTLDPEKSSKSTSKERVASRFASRVALLLTVCETLPRTARLSFGHFCDVCAFTGSRL